MKIKKYSLKQELELWKFFRDNLPPSLRVSVIGDGYGGVCMATVKNSTGWRRFFDFNGVAQIRESEVELFHPQYYSDMEIVCQKYEKQTGKQVTLIYWED